MALLRERLGARAQLGVGKDRYANGRTLEQHGARWFILDDGFQHLALRRDADIVLLDSTDPFGGGALLPAGRLREPRTALARAEIVVLTRTERAPALETVVRRYTVAPIFYAWAELEAVLRVPAMAVALPEADWKQREVFCFLRHRQSIGVSSTICGDGDSSWPGSAVSATITITRPPMWKRSIARAIAAGAERCSAPRRMFSICGIRSQPQLPIYACRIRLALSDAEGFWSAVLADIRRNRPDLKV